VSRDPAAYAPHNRTACPREARLKPIATLNGTHKAACQPELVQQRAFAGIALTAAVLAVTFVASAREVVGLGFLLWFRNEGQGVRTDGTVLLITFLLAVTLSVGAFAGCGRLRSVETAANAAAKAALLLAVLFMLVHPDLPQFENKSQTFRAILFPLLAFAPMTVAMSRSPRQPYPILIDLCLTMVLAMDIVGNDLHWYGNYAHWDDCVHFISSIPLMIVIVTVILALERNGVLRLGFWLALIGGSAVYGSLHGLWEMSEFLSDRMMGTELQPGGMEEATRNNVASMGGTIVAVGLLWWWRSSALLTEGLVRPLASYLGTKQC
jgi:hypothetical protein